MMTRFCVIVALLACGFIGARGNTPVPKPVCDASKSISVRYSSTSQRIYLESADGSRGGCATPTSVYEALGEESPFYPLETPGEWMLDESLYILDGIVLNVYGTGIGGDCDYLKLRSDSTVFVNIRAHGGSLDVRNTKVTSWDPSISDVDSDWSDGRSFISAISEVVLDESETCQGVAKNNMGEARMDIENSEIAYLGYEAAESWGISWKLRGICNDKSNREQYNGIGVYGNLLGSDVHHLYYGHYGYAQLYALLSGNTVHDNEVYGFDPHDDSINITISDNEVYYNFNHGIIFSKYCHNTVVTNNHVHDNGGVGIFPHYVSDNAMIAHNIIERNGDSGIAFLESSGGFVYNNTVRENVHGIRHSVGSRNNVIAANAFENNEGYDWYQYAGNDPVAEVESGNPTNIVLYANKFGGNVGGARLDDSVHTQFVSNRVDDWADMEFRDSSNTLVLGNTFPSDMTYTSTSSCLNSASDVDFGDICSTPAMADPFDHSDFERMLGVEESTVGTQAPTDFHDSQISTPAPADTADASASPTGTVHFTVSPIAVASETETKTPGPTAVTKKSLIASDTNAGYLYSDSDDGSVGVSVGENDSGGDTMSPTPTASMVPGVAVDDANVDRDSSGGQASRVGYAVLSGIGLLVVIIFTAI